jgi:hypothetical protein
MTPDVDKLKAAIKRLHGCESTYSESVRVTEAFHGRVVWDGIVSVFGLVSHPATDTCYAWSYRDDDGADRYFAVLKLPPVISAETAVRAVIVSEFKNRPK